MMRLGIIAAPVEESFKMAAGKGLDFLEFCINGNQNPEKNSTQNVEELSQNVENLKRWMDQYNVAVGSIGRWGPDRIDTEGNIIQSELEASKKLIDVASLVGCDNYVCGCNYVETLSFYQNCTSAIQYFSELIEYGKSKGVLISVYNCRWNNFVVEPVAWNIILGHLKELGIKFDPSHCIYAGGDYLKEMRDWGHRFNHVHIKGSLRIEGKRFDDPPAGLDETNWGAFMAVLYAVKYNRGLSIEPHSANWKGELGEWGVDFTVEYMKKLLFKREV